MPEARDRLPGRGPGGSALLFGNGAGLFFAERSRNGSQVRCYRDPFVNNENAPPQWSRSRRRTPSSGSPLPEWYPRTPLRDITAIINAIELRNERERALAAATRRRNALHSPRTPFLLSSPSSEEPGSSSVSALSLHSPSDPQKEDSPPVSPTASGLVDEKKRLDWEKLDQIAMATLEKKRKEMQEKKSKLMSMR